MTLGVSSDDLTADSKFEFDCGTDVHFRSATDTHAALQMSETTPEKVLHQDFKNGWFIVRLISILCCLVEVGLRPVLFEAYGI